MVRGSDLLAFLRSGESLTGFHHGAAEDAEIAAAKEFNDSMSSVRSRLNAATDETTASEIRGEIKRLKEDHAALLKEIRQRLYGIANYRTTRWPGQRFDGTISDNIRLQIQRNSSKPLPAADGQQSSTTKTRSTS